MFSSHLLPPLCNFSPISTQCQHTDLQWIYLSFMQTFPKPFIFSFITFTDFLLFQCRFIGIILGSDTINLIYMAKLCVPYTRRYHTKGRPYMTNNKTEMRKEPETHPAQIINSNQISFWANFFVQKFRRSSRSAYITSN